MVQIEERLLVLRRRPGLMASRLTLLVRCLRCHRFRMHSMETMLIFSNDAAMAN